MDERPSPKGRDGKPATVTSSHPQLRRRMSGPRPRGQDGEWWLMGWPNPCLDELVRRSGIRQDRERLEIRLLLPVVMFRQHARPWGQIQVSSPPSNLKAMSLVLMTSPAHTKRGTPASSSFACSTKSGRGTGLMAGGGAAWRPAVWSPFFPWKSKTAKLSGSRYEMMSTAGRPGWANELPHLRSASKGGCQDQRSQALASLLLIRAVPHHLHGHTDVSCFRDSWRRRCIRSKED